MKTKIKSKTNNKEWGFDTQLSKNDLKAFKKQNEKKKQNSREYHKLMKIQDEIMRQNYE